MARVGPGWNPDPRLRAPVDPWVNQSGSFTRELGPAWGTSQRPVPGEDRAQPGTQLDWSRIDDLIKSLMSGGGGSGMFNVSGMNKNPTYPTPKDAGTFFPDWEMSKLERNARLSEALEGVRGQRGAIEDIALTSAARSGLAPKSGVVQGRIENLLAQNMADEAMVRRGAFIEEEAARRAREDLIGNLRAMLEQSRVGAFADIQSAWLRNQPAFAQLAFEGQMANEKLPWEKWLMFRDAIAPFFVDFPSGTPVPTRQR